MRRIGARPCRRADGEVAPDAASIAGRPGDGRLNIVDGLDRLGFSDWAVREAASAAAWVGCRPAPVPESTFVAAPPSRPRTRPPYHALRWTRRRGRGVQRPSATAHRGGGHYSLNDVILDAVPWFVRRAARVATPCCNAVLQRETGVATPRCNTTPAGELAFRSRCGGPQRDSQGARPLRPHTLAERS